MERRRSDTNAIGQVGVTPCWPAKASRGESHGYHRFHKRERKKKQKRKRKCTTTTVFYTRKRGPCTPSQTGYSFDPGGSRLLADVGPIYTPITRCWHSTTELRPHRLKSPFPTHYRGFYHQVKSLPMRFVTFRYPIYTLRDTSLPPKRQISARFVAARIGLAGAIRMIIRGAAPSRSSVPQHLPFEQTAICDSRSAWLHFWDCFAHRRRFSSSYFIRSP